MRSRFLNNLNMNRKSLYILLSVLIFSIFSLTIVYGALSTTLNINGIAEINSVTWDIHLDNVILNSRSVTTNIPTITDSRSASFSTTLSKPGDFYEFTIDVVNSGSIDAMIDSVIKTPELTATQKKYLNYIVEYQNGESITERQLVKTNSFVRLKVKVEFRNDIPPSDLPTIEEDLNLSFVINYVQTSDEGIEIEGGVVKNKLQIISGDINTIGSEIAIGDEHFYLVSNNGTSIVTLAKYNLYVGNTCTASNACTPYGDEATGIQDSTMLGYTASSEVKNGTIAFSETNYWQNITEYPAYVYDNNSMLYNYHENYKLYLESYGISINEVRPIKYEELEQLGCDTTAVNCLEAPEWVYSTSYWSGTASKSTNLWHVNSDADFYTRTYTVKYFLGIRPVVEIPLSEFS